MYIIYICIFQYIFCILRLGFGRNLDYNKNGKPQLNAKRPQTHSTAHSYKSVKIKIVLLEITNRMRFLTPTTLHTPCRCFIVY